MCLVVSFVSGIRLWPTLGRAVLCLFQRLEGKREGYIADGYTSIRGLVSLSKLGIIKSGARGSCGSKSPRYSANATNHMLLIGFKCVHNRRIGEKHRNSVFEVQATFAEQSSFNRYSVDEAKDFLPKADDNIDTKCPF